MALIALLLCALFHLVHSKMLLPGPSGPCQVQIKSTELIDHSRVDPYSPTHDARAIMVSAFAPVNCGELQYTPYIPPRIFPEASQKMKLPNSTLNVFDLPSFAPSEHQNTTKEYPVILFSPGMGSSRLIYANLLEEIASAGYLVISIDHPHDAAAVEFPDGHVIPMNPSIPHNVSLALQTRVGDVVFTLNQLQHKTQSITPPSFSSSLHLNHVSIVGHSEGGATAAATMLNDMRFAGGVNLDGSLFGPVVHKGLDRPFINIGDPHLAKEQKWAWDVIWERLRGYRLQLRINDIKHLGFTDLPLVFDSAPNAKVLRNESAEHLGSLPGLGTLPGLRVRTILAEYITAACEFFVTGEKAGLLNRASPVYPEVVYVRQ